MKLYIKNMVCNRCKSAVKEVLEKAGFHPALIMLGEVEIVESPNKQQLQAIDLKLREIGFERLDDKKSQTVEKIKKLIIELVQLKDNDLPVTLSTYLADQVGQDYSALSNLFSHLEGTTIEQFYILQKIERVKELLVYGELNLNEISDLLHYSSASHLARQFRKITGLTPSYFKTLGNEKRRTLDEI